MGGYPIAFQNARQDGACGMAFQDQGRTHIQKNPIVGGALEYAVLQVQRPADLIQSDRVVPGLAKHAMRRDQAILRVVGAQQRLVTNRLVMRQTKYWLKRGAQRVFAKASVSESALDFDVGEDLLQPRKIYAIRRRWRWGRGATRTRRIRRQTPFRRRLRRLGRLRLGLRAIAKDRNGISWIGQEASQHEICSVAHRPFRVRFRDGLRAKQVRL